MQFIVKISIFLMHQIKSYSGINIENVPDETQILKILRQISNLSFAFIFNWVYYQINNLKIQSYSEKSSNFQEIPALDPNSILKFQKIIVNFDSCGL
jgi:hypothetical protein